MQLITETKLWPPNMLLLLLDVWTVDQSSIKPTSVWQLTTAEDLKDYFQHIIALLQHN